MAKITFGPTVSEARGKAGDTVYTRTRGGAVARALSIAPPPVGEHNLLSATHLDTEPATPPVRGSVVTAQGETPKWTELALGAAGQLLATDGVDVLWIDPPAGGIASMVIIAAALELAANNLIPANAAWPVANMAFFVPFTLPEDATVKRLMFASQQAEANYDIGIYNQAGVRQVHSGSLAKGTTAQAVVADIADTALVAGRYYLALALDNNTGQLYRAGAAPGYNTLIGVREMAAAFPLPANAVFAETNTRTYIPVLALTLQPA